MQKILLRIFFVKLWEKPDLWLEREKLTASLYTVVRNHIYNF